MNRLLTLMAAFLIGIAVYAQEDIFSWNGDEVIAKSKFTPLIETDHTLPAGITQYVVNELTIKSPYNNDNYILKTFRFDQSKYDGIAIPYDRFVLLFKGKPLMNYLCGDALHTVALQTMGQNKSYYQVIPLDDDAFALMLGGWFFGYAEAPEMMVIVIKGNRAKIVFDNHAYAYKYQAPPAFSMEFVDDVDWYEDECVKEGGSWIPNAAALSARTKHKIWREGNVLKYKSWK